LLLLLLLLLGSCGDRHEVGIVAIRLLHLRIEVAHHVGLLLLLLIGRHAHTHSNTNANACSAALLLHALLLLLLLLLVLILEVLELDLLLQGIEGGHRLRILLGIHLLLSHLVGIHLLLGTRLLLGRLRLLLHRIETATGPLLRLLLLLERLPLTEHLGQGLLGVGIQRRPFDTIC